MVSEGELGARLAAVRARIASAAERAGRDPRSVTLVGVSKTMPLAIVRNAYRAGLAHFGENRVQEATAKFADFKPADLTLHLVGHLQRNKAGKAVGLFDVFHSVDSLALAESLSVACREQSAPLPILLEVNVAGEESKFGLAPAEVLPLLERVASLKSLTPRGLMTIAPLVADPEQVRPIFRQLRALRDECQARLGLELPHLSMGMTNDFEVAVEEGATLVRVGRAIFGERARDSGGQTPG